MSDLIFFFLRSEVSKNAAALIEPGLCTVFAERVIVLVVSPVFSPTHK
jgi:hypothetical protein